MCYDIDECDNIECKIREDFKKDMEDKKWKKVLMFQSIKE
jgi:hypothetical protein